MSCRGCLVHLLLLPQRPDLWQRSIDVDAQVRHRCGVLTGPFRPEGDDVVGLRNEAARLELGRREADLGQMGCEFGTHRLHLLTLPERTEIGRASCRERVCQYV